MTYRVIFDSARPGILPYWFPSGGFIIILAAIRTFFFYKRARLPSRGIPFIVLVGSILWTTIAFFETNKAYHRLAAALEDNRCSVVEGRVEKFNPGSVVGKTSETFNVGNCHFFYSPGLLTGGFNQIRSLGGPIYEGEQVRIHYLGNDIARLEIGQ